ncbi:MAG: heavy metal translocating P-type ATPase [Pseudomonadota bacterium]
MTAMACPGCAAAPTGPAPQAVAGDVLLSLPHIHCVSCIRGVETALAARPDVRDVRVNLTLKRAMVRTEASADSLAETLVGAGIEAYPLDVAALSAEGADKAGRELLMRLAVAGFAMMNVMLLSVAVWSGAAEATRDLFHWISAAIAIPASLFCGAPFFASAWGALRAGRMNMDVPIALAIVLALGTSLYETWHSGHHAYFDAAITLCFFLLIGRYLDLRARSAARSAAQELTALEVPVATRVTGETVPLAQIAVGDALLVRPGARMPVDGTIRRGASELDRSLLTGEAEPQAATSGDAVHAGEVNLTGPLEVTATAVGRDSSLHRLADLVALAEAGRARHTPLADKAAALYAPGVHILSALSFMGWILWTGDLRLALNIAAAVLIITCPCALGLAVPAVTAAASGRLYRAGLLVKSATALERLAEVDTVVFDKTGTLTAGTPRVTGWQKLHKDAASVAKGLGAASDHPLAQAIRAEEGPVAQITALREVPGSGVEGLWQGTPVRMGRASWIGAEPVEGLATYLQVGTATPQPIRFTDNLRAGAAELVQTLQARGLRVLMLSGDTTPAVNALAIELGIAEAEANLRPEEKASRMAALAGQGAKVLMVGDGLNDTAALAAAHVSIAPASALEAARAASDMVLTHASLMPVAGALEIAGKATRRISENFTIATVYNVVAVPLAALGLCTPLVAALAMSGSSLTVVLNALRITR